MINFKQDTSERRYPIGYSFMLKRGKRDPEEHTIVDYVITHNSKGEITSFKYLTTKEFLTQIIKDVLVQSTIDIATNNEWKDLNRKD